jgi:Importin-beta N-terminal domain
VQIAASVQLGIVVEHHWKFVEPEQARRITVEGFNFIILAPEDKQLVRENILGCLYKSMCG